MKRTLLSAACALVLVPIACSDDLGDDCANLLNCPPSGGQGGAGATAGNGGNMGGSGGGGAGATGGANGGAGAGGMPECTNDIDCTDAGNAHCDAGSCAPCIESPHCEGVTGLPVCDAGTCVQCQLGEEDACTAPQTCDLLAKTCAPVPPLSVQNCRACTNDAQCEAGHRCIPMDFPDGVPHGYYCLKEVDPTCEQPFQIPTNQQSISGVAAVNYCGINEDLTTCEAVNALLLNWRCSGTEGMCSPDGILPEQAVPGALCEQVGVAANRCTYACGDAGQCLDPIQSPPKSTCGNGDMTPPGWCGG